ncbi:Nuclear_LIM interactor-interacting factor [Hexamita inflata]|uniref:Mitochondrial import inner membrane translocase subunit TIM50 n=1 Tax=Hexamita inflata TaxID=28002 RepID=A0AA86PKL1_9EUKA|nr:Nuclear LIM interactor-interacting factor [Hexamita inflata]CAI9944751.1 Nuclear LIM interactor-interacting factor [Hexamita inflata]
MGSSNTSCIKPEEIVSNPTQDDIVQLMVKNQTEDLMESRQYLVEMHKESPPRILLSGESTVTTLVIDLDETLIHSIFDFTNQCETQIKLPVTQQTADFQVDFDLNYITVYLCVRNYARQFIEDLSSLYEIVIWTASPYDYAKPIIDYLGIMDKLAAVLYRSECSIMDDQMYKDLDNLGRDKNVIIVDNNPQCYKKHPQNGINIVDFEGKQDNALETLSKYLKEFATKGYKMDTLVHKWPLK